MKEQLITFETAKLAKEKRFNLECLHYYDKNGYKPDRWESSGSSTDTDVPIYLEEFYHNYNSKGWANVECSAPTQSLLQKWLRNVHNILIYVDPRSHHIFQYHIITSDNEIIGSNRLNSWEETLEEGLKAALKLI